MAITDEHESHDLCDVSMSWGSRRQCETCHVTLSVTNEEGGTVWKAGDAPADLAYLLRGRDFYPAARG